MEMRLGRTYKVPTHEATARVQCRNVGSQKLMHRKPRPGRSQVLGSCRTTTSQTPPTLSITTPSPPFQTYLPPPPLHLTLTVRETLFLTKSCCRLIFKPSFLLLLISFTLFTFPSASCWTFLLKLHWLPATFNVVPSTTTCMFTDL